MRLVAVEVVAVAGFQYINLAADGHFQLAADHGAGFFAFVVEHVRAGIGAGWVGLVEEGEGTVGVTLADQFHGDFVGADIQQFVGAVDHLALGVFLQLQREEIDQRHRDA